MSKHICGNNDGFTLLELLISMALMGMLAIALFGGLHFGTRVWQAASVSADSNDRVVLAQAAVGDEIAAAYPEFVRLSATEAHVQFEGTSSRVTFLAPARSPYGALEWVTIGIANVGGAPSLVMLTALELQPRAVQRYRTVLLKGVRSFNIAYYGSGTPHDPPSWRTYWRDNLNLPALVRIRATLTNRQAIWPDLVIAPHVSVDQSCTYDGLTHYCQGRT